MIERRIPPCGDPFHAAGSRTPDPDEAPHVCSGGFVYVGHMAEDENGAEVEVFDAVPCRRCAADNGRS